MTTALVLFLEGQMHLHNFCASILLKTIFKIKLNIQCHSISTLHILTFLRDAYRLLKLSQN